MNRKIVGMCICLLLLVPIFSMASAMEDTTKTSPYESTGLSRTFIWGFLIGIEKDENITFSGILNYRIIGQHTTGWIKHIEIPPSDLSIFKIRPIGPINFVWAIFDGTPTTIAV